MFSESSNGLFRKATSCIKPLRYYSELLKHQQIDWVLPLRTIESSVNKKVILMRVIISIHLRRSKITGNHIKLVMMLLTKQSFCPLRRMLMPDINFQRELLLWKWLRITRLGIICYSSNIYCFDVIYWIVAVALAGKVIIEISCSNNTGEATKRDNTISILTSSSASIGFLMICILEC